MASNTLKKYFKSQLYIKGNDVSNCLSTAIFLQYTQIYREHTVGFLICMVHNRKVDCYL
jgi:hypothetical protein